MLLLHKEIYMNYHQGIVLFTITTLFFCVEAYAINGDECLTTNTCSPFSASSPTNDVDILITQTNYAVHVILDACAKGHCVIVNETSGATNIVLISSGDDNNQEASATILLQDMETVISVTASNNFGCRSSYQLTIRRSIPELFELAITNALVDYNSSNVYGIIGGTLSGETGALIIVWNQANGFVEQMSVASNWSSGPIPLAVGPNVISACASGQPYVVFCAYTNLVGIDLSPEIIISDRWEDLFPWKSSAVLTGAINQFAVGMISANNLTTGDLYEFNAPTSQPYTWISPDIYLAPGTNIIILSVTNSFGTRVERNVQVNRILGVSRYVDDDSSFAQPPYTNWSTAASNIQDAIAVCSPGDIVHVNDGLYNQGFAVAPLDRFRVAITNVILLKSVNGADVTIIEGQGPHLSPNAVRGVYMVDGAEIVGFTIRQGHQSRHSFGAQNVSGIAGGGIRSAIRNCIVRESSSTAIVTGGIVSDTIITANTGMWNFVIGAQLDRCIITDNIITNNHRYLFSTVRANNSLIKENNAKMSINSTFKHCIIQGNVMEPTIPFAENSSFSGCVIIDNQGNIPTGTTIDESCVDRSDWLLGSGNITNDPRFMDIASGDYRLQVDSPCIDKVFISTTALDFARVERPLDGDGDGIPVADIGLFEYIRENVDSDRDGIDDDYEVHAFFSNPAAVDSDRDNSSDLEELIAGTDPRDFRSHMKMFAFTPSYEFDGHRATIAWISSVGRLYSISKKTDMHSAFEPIPNAQDIPGTGNIMTYYDDTQSPLSFYQMSVRRE